MDISKVIDNYYELANAGNWAPWCELFAENTVIDEQLAGRIEGRERLREIVAGFPTVYSSFRNTPRHVVVSGDQATVFSHISAISCDGTGIEADVANYFRLGEGGITYMTNVHDTVPFRPILPA